MALLDRLDGRLVGRFSEPEVSGYRRERPGLLAMLQRASAREIDVIVCEAMERIAPDDEDIAWLGKKLRYDRIRLYMAAEGEIDDVKLVVAGMMGAMFLSNLRVKTLRGMEVAVLGGRIAGGQSYGYRRSDVRDARWHRAWHVRDRSRSR